MSEILEIERACKVLEETDTNISLLHCVSSYPTDLIDSNINAIKTLQRLWPNYTIGQSDHTPDIKVPLYSVACGAKIIEKHFMVEKDCVDAEIDFKYKKDNNRKIKNSDLLFIDNRYKASALKKELSKHGPNVFKYILINKTEEYKEESDIRRNGFLNDFFPSIS